MKKLKEVSEEQKKFAVDVMVALVVEELMNDLKLDPTTGTLLYDGSSKLWWNGPSYIAICIKRKFKRHKPDR